jgi:hypothetical protein
MPKSIAIFKGIVIVTAGTHKMYSNQHSILQQHEGEEELTLLAKKMIGW